MTLPDRISLNIKMRNIQSMLRNLSKSSQSKIRHLRLSSHCCIDFSDSYQLKFGVGEKRPHHRTRLNSRSNIIGVSPLYDYRDLPYKLIGEPMDRLF